MGAWDDAAEEGSGVYIIQKGQKYIIRSISQTICWNQSDYTLVGIVPSVGLMLAKVSENTQMKAISWKSTTIRPELRGWI